MNAPWEKKRPEKLGKPKRLTADQKAAAKKFADKNNLPWPSLVASMFGARQKK